MWWKFYWWGNRHFGLGPLVWWIQLGFWGLALGGIFYLFSRLRNRPPDNLQKNQEPLLILKKRFALGEITEDELKRMTFFCTAEHWGLVYIDL